MRIIFLTMFFSSVFMFESFNASYTSFLSVVSFTKPFASIEQLEQTSFTIGSIAGSASINMFRVKAFGSKSLSSLQAMQFLLAVACKDLKITIFASPSVPQPVRD